eukprot:6327278-Prymnesium_polylepis.2
MRRERQGARSRPYCSPSQSSCSPRRRSGRSSCRGTASQSPAGPSGASAPAMTAPRARESARPHPPRTANPTGARRLARRHRPSVPGRSTAPRRWASAAAQARYSTVRRPAGRGAQNPCSSAANPSRRAATSSPTPRGTRPAAPGAACRG